MAWTWPRIERRGALLWLAALVVFGLWQGNTVWFALQADQLGTPWSRPLLWELTGAVSAYLVTWIPIATVTNAPAPAGRWPRFLAIHVTGYLAFTVLHTSTMLGVRFALHRALGWGHYDYGGGSTAFRLAMESSKDVVDVAAVEVGGRCCTPRTRRAADRDKPANQP